MVMEVHSNLFIGKGFLKKITNQICKVPTANSISPDVRNTPTQFPKQLCHPVTLYWRPLSAQMRFHLYQYLEMAHACKTDISSGIHIQDMRNTGARKCYLLSLGHQLQEPITKMFIKSSQETNTNW